MARTTAMRLMELMVLREDVRPVLKYLGKLGDFQFQQDFEEAEDGSKTVNADESMFLRLNQAREALSIKAPESYSHAVSLPSEKDEEEALRICETVEAFHQKETEALEDEKRISAACEEALAFANLNVSYSQLESLSFLTMRIGKIKPSQYEALKEKAGDRIIITPLDDSRTRILAACSKKARFMLDSFLKEADFVEMEIPKDFKGVPEEMLDSLRIQKKKCEDTLKEVEEERKNFAETHEEKILNLLELYSVASQITKVQNKLSATQFVYRITGWIPAYESRKLMKDIDEMTKGRTGIREFLPDEVDSVIHGREKVPVKLKHGKLVSNFERLIFSYGSPIYGAIDPTPFVAVFFTVLFGIMFGDAGQGLVFLIAGILMTMKKMKLMGWEKFGRVFICIGASSMVMGFLTGEFFTNEELLIPVSRFIKGLFGVTDPKALSEPILKMMPSKESTTRMFMFFGFTVAVGFLINTCGLIINILNNISLKRFGRAFFGKNGLSGAVFFWYVVWFALKIAFLGASPELYDWCIIGGSLAVTAFCEPIERLIEKERPVFENGVFAAFIGALVEIIEVLSGYISNTVSFLRVGAFALAHAVLGYIISMMAEIAGAGGIAVLILGNAIDVVLEGMIVAIQVVRLQYYEFFSKFFNETGREFKPFKFEYK